MSWGNSERDRQLQNMIRVGTVAEVNPAEGRARVNFGAAKSAWILFTAGRAGGVNMFSPPSVGEQVIVASPGGDTAQGVILSSLPSGGNPAPGAAADSWVLTIGAVTVTITDGTVAISGGDVIVTGGDVIADGVSLKTHTHGHGDPAGETAPPS